MITFEVEEEKYDIHYNIQLLYAIGYLVNQVNFLMIFRFPLFGKKYQLKFAGDTSAETHCLVHFPSLIR